MFQTIYLQGGWVVKFLKRLVVTRRLTASVSVLLGLASFSPVLFLARPRPTISVVFVPNAIVFSVATNTIFRITMCHLGSTKSLDSFVPNRDPTVFWGSLNVVYFLGLTDTQSSPYS